MEITLPWLSCALLSLQLLTMIRRRILSINVRLCFISCFNFLLKHTKSRKRTKIERLSFSIALSHFQKQLESCQLDTYLVAPRPSRFWLVYPKILYCPSRILCFVESNAATIRDQTRETQRPRYVGEPQLWTFLALSNVVRTWPQFECLICGCSQSMIELKSVWNCHHISD